jgi:ribokinase
MSNLFLNVPSENRRFKAMIGTGGIGAGSLFLLSGNHTLGREESRGGKYLDARDYCKLHIITHYVKVLLGPDFPIFPIGKIGDDHIGYSIYNEMEQVGLDMQYVRYSANDITLFGFCFLYPDGTGGNLTTEESACTKVDPAFIETATSVFSEYAGNFISLAAPEVPLSARNRLLELTRKYKGFGVASFTSGEMIEAEEKGILGLVDLLAINIDEAFALIHMDAETNEPLSIIEKAIKRMQNFNPSAWLSITAGKQGSWSWDGSHLSYASTFPVKAKSSAGAGDAHIAAIIAGLIAGLTLQQSQILGNLTGAFSVTSQHTIHPDISRKSLKDLALKFHGEMEPFLLKLLSD